MPIYDINFINNLSKTMTSYKLNSDVENYLNNILLDIKKPIYNIVPNFSSNSYNKKLSQRRLDSVVQMFQEYEIDGKNAFNNYLTSGDLSIPKGESLGEEFCNNVLYSGVLNL